jgi:hypothetical protein
VSPSNEKEEFHEWFLGLGALGILTVCCDNRVIFGLVRVEPFKDGPILFRVFGDEALNAECVSCVFKPRFHALVVTAVDNVTAIFAVHILIGPRMVFWQNIRHIRVEDGLDPETFIRISHRILLKYGDAPSGQVRYFGMMAHVE